MKVNEIQKFKFNWLKWLTGILILGLIILFIIGIVLQIPNAPLIAVCGIIFVSIIFISINFSVLKTEYNEKEILYKFFPFSVNQKRINLSEIKSVSFKTIDPVGEFGGYGIRFKSNISAYIVSPNVIYIECRNNKIVVLSVSNVHEIEKYIRNVGLQTTL